MPPPGDRLRGWQFGVWALDAPTEDLGLHTSVTCAEFGFSTLGHPLASGTPTGLFGACRPPARACRAEVADR